MSAYSTLRISREKAFECYTRQFLRARIPDQELERFMNEVLEDHLYNCRITEDAEDDDLIMEYWVYEYLDKRSNA